jgi:outer membrane protein assembly factor BamB/DNA-directed RNA polymerase subunit RPC12/RpoP
MKLIVVTCPHCGGRIQTAEATDQIRCEYCGTLSRLQRRTRMLERVLPPPPMAPGRPAPIAVQHRRRGVGVIIAMSALVPTAIGGAVAYTVLGSSSFTSSRAPTRGPAATANAIPPDPPSWQGGAPLLADLDGDGTPEVIGRSRRVGKVDEIRVIALDGKTGKPRWESEPLGNYSDTYQGPLVLAGDLVLFASQRAEVRAFAAADGKRRWTTTLEERVVRFCDQGATIVAVGKDDVERPLVRASGARAAATAEAAPPAAPPPKRRTRPGRATACESAPSDNRGMRDHHLEWAIADKVDLAGDRLVIGPGGRVASGTRRKGTRVPTLVALDAANKARWRVELPADPLAAGEGAPGAVAVGDAVVCGSYGLGGAGWRASVACFALADGRRLWDRGLGNTPMSSLQIAGPTLLISASGWLETRDLDTGATRWTFGG